MGRYAEAITLYEATTRKFKGKLGPDHPETLASMNNLALTYQAAGKLDKALTLIEQTLERQKAQLGPDHSNTLTSMNNLALAYKAAGKLDKALTLIEQTLERQKAKLGPEHPETLTSMNNLATFFWAMKRLDRSIPLFEVLLPILKRKLGEDHPNTLSTMGSLGVNYRDAGRLTEAIPLLEEVHRKGRKHASLWGVGRDLVSAYIQAGKTAEAAALITDELAIDRLRAAADSPQMANQLAVAGMQRLELKAYADAELPLRECLAIRARTSADVSTIFHAKSLLGASLLGQKKYAEAEPLLLSAYEGLMQREARIPPQGKIRTEALEHLVQLYDAWGRKDKADEWRMKLPASNSAKPAETKND
jgi:tetratricopeptide (TPR) repeat protein